MNFGYYQPYWLDEEVLEHHGVKGMKWGIRKSEDKTSTETKNLKKFKRNVAIGSAVALSALAVYGAYRYKDFILNENVKMAIENGKKLADQMRNSDINAAKKYPELYDVKPDSYYKKYIKEAEDKARSQSFKEAYKNVKVRSAKIREKVERNKTLTNLAKKTIKSIKKKEMFSSPQLLFMYQKNNPEILEGLDIKIVDGHIFEKGKKIY